MLLLCECIPIELGRGILLRSISAAKVDTFLMSVGEEAILTSPRRQAKSGFFDIKWIAEDLERVV
jgi:hypothetical protein